MISRYHILPNKCVSLLVITASYVCSSSVKERKKEQKGGPLWLDKTRETVAGAVGSPFSVVCWRKVTRRNHWGQDNATDIYKRLWYKFFSGEHPLRSVVKVKLKARKARQWTENLTPPPVFVRKILGRPIIISHHLSLRHNRDPGKCQGLCDP